MTTETRINALPLVTTAAREDVTVIDTPAGTRQIAVYNLAKFLSEILLEDGFDAIVVNWDSIVNEPSTFPPSVHGHPISDVTGLQGALDAKAPLASPALTGTPTAPTATPGTNTTQIATTAFVAAGDALLVARASNLSDLANVGTARTNLGLGGLATLSTVVNADMATMAAGTIKGNVTGGSAVPADSSLSAFLDLISSTRGSIIHRGAAGWVALAPGIAGNVLRTNGAGADPSWAATSEKLAQVVSTVTGAVATGTTIIPADDTIPQVTEGDQYLSRTITPTNASSTLLIEVTVFGAHSSASAGITAALFKDGAANAIAAGYRSAPGAGSIEQVTFQHVISAGSTSAQMFTVRVGGSAAGTFTLNGSGGGRVLGGVLQSTIVITEILP